MMGWVFAGITFSAVLMATFERQMRRAILALWVAGIGVGAMYLTVGAEFLAITQMDCFDVGCDFLCFLFCHVR